MSANSRRIAALCILTCAVLTAQNNSGTVQGTVRDTQEAAIPAATVTITNTATAVAKTVPVTQSGEYTAPFLMPGTYNVSAQAAGFKQTTEAGIVLRVSDRLVIDIHLEVGAHAEMVTVQATTPLLETANVTLGKVVDTRQILDLPLNGRDALSLAALAPGVTPQSPAVGAAVQLGNTVPSVN